MVGVVSSELEADRKSSGVRFPGRQGGGGEQVNRENGTRARNSDQKEETPSPGIRKDDSSGTYLSAQTNLL